MTKIWHFGNTTVRNPERIRNGLVVLFNSGLNGNLNGKHYEKLFADELDRSGVVTIVDKERDYSDLGRKWRSCFSQLGLITHKIQRELDNAEKDETIKNIVDKNKQLNLSGKPYEITPNGKLMIGSEIFEQQQECFLRALLAYEIPSVIEPNNGKDKFYPFILVLKLLEKLISINNNLGLSKYELAIVQTYRSYSNVNNIIKDILNFREKYNKGKGRVEKRKTEKELLKFLSSKSNIKPESILDYADVNYRYIRFTGLVTFEGNRITFNKKKNLTIDSILKDERYSQPSKDKEAYLTRLWNGSHLPTDNEKDALKQLNRYKELLLDLGVNEDKIIPYDEDSDIRILNQKRVKLEQLYKMNLEEEYAKKQSENNQIEEIIKYLKILENPRLKRDYDLEIFDNASFLEWSVWRSFLAIDNLENKPFDSRGFEIDQDFYPIGCAPSGRPDLVFEFKDFILIVEVTLTTSSRQEAAEGEPVRRHIAKFKMNYLQDSNKHIYGLFLSKIIDNNTAETFRIGVWYDKDKPIFINIVPISLNQFINIMNKFLIYRFSENKLKELFDHCLIPRNAHAPIWKSEINNIINDFINS